jgi:hypothetical protein
MPSTIPDSPRGTPPRETNALPRACRLRLIVGKVNSMGVTDGTIMAIIMIVHIAKIISRSAKPHAPVLGMAMPWGAIYAQSEGGL